MTADIATAKVITPRGRGAVATVLLSGICPPLDESPLFRAANGRPVSEQSLGRIVFGRWGNDPGEEVVLCRIDEQTLEIHCHGGDAAVLRILSDLNAAGCRTIDWEEAGILVATLEAECEHALAHATTIQSAAILLDQQGGALRRTIDTLFISDWNSETRATASTRIEALLRWAEFGLHLVHPWNVVLAGRPNVGKSSLINALVGYARAIVHDRPGTTRDVVTAETALQGWPIRFADTAGLRDNAEQIEAAGIVLAQEQFTAADCRILVIDRNRPPTDEDRKLINAWPDAILVANKSDLPDAWSKDLPAESLPVSARSTMGMDNLAATIIQRLVPNVPPAGTAVPFTARQLNLLQMARQALDQQNCAAYESAVAAIEPRPIKET